MGEHQQRVRGPENSQNSLLDEIFAKLTDQLKDLSYVEVITATGSPTDSRRHYSLLKKMGYRPFLKVV